MRTLLGTFRDSFHFSPRRGSAAKANSTTGFTLIELLVVIAIIGILSSVVLASLNTARQKGRDTRRISDIKQLQLALELYYDVNGGYPTAAKFYGPSTDTSSLVGAGYISVIPADPGSTTACETGGEASCYRYAALGASTCSSYHLGTTLEVSGNSAFSSDVDALSTEAVCSGNTTSNFPGADTGQCNAADFGTSGCYDVKP